MAATHTFTSIAHLLLLFSFCPLRPPYSQAAIEPASPTDTQTFRCSEIERKALLSFKQSLLDPSGRLSSWVGEDCCKWIGVGCDSRTGHVVMLDLKNPLPVAEFDDEFEEWREALNKSSFGGKISTSLLDLKNLSYLDLSLNDFTGNKIPEFLGSLQSLRYLNLSFSFFAGVIPPHLGNLSRLQYLDLESVYEFGGLDVKNLKWLVGFRSLKYLNLGYANLMKVPDWLEAVNTLSSLLELHLSGCGLISLPHSLSPINFTMLSVLDLSFNYFNSSIPHWLSNVSELSILNLAENFFLGAIPEAFADLDSLQELDLSSNSIIEVPLLVGLGHLTHLRKLDLSGNNIHGKIPSSFANLCNLQTLVLASNNISGEINEFVDGLSRCSNTVLESLNLMDNILLGGKLPYSIGALQKLKSISLSFCSFRGTIPDTIGNLSSLQTLGFSVNQMSGTIPKSIGKLSMLVTMVLGGNYFWEGVLTGAFFQNLTRLKELDLSSRSENSTLVLDVKHDWVPPFNLDLLFLDHVRIGPSFPTWLQTQNGLLRLSLEHVVIFDPIPENIGKLWPNLEYLNLASNSIIGEIPPSVGLLKNLSKLLLRNNCLSGELFPHWEDLKYLQCLDVANNNISGNLPSSMGYLTSLEYLSLSKNHLEGQLPSGFRNYTRLVTLDLGRNNFSENLTAWIGKSLSTLSRLNLRSNWFYGDIPQDLCLLSKLKILDLAQNNLSGGIPHCLGNLSKNENDGILGYEEMELVWKGREYLYKDSNIFLVYSLDLSNNNLSGEIPEDITTISLLVNLNLSMNRLTGKIPKGIGNLHHLESLDLSRNTLSGFLPQELSSLTFLSHLNLSFNNFSGKISSGNQLRTLNDPSMYEGNSLLCGPPLSTKCPWEGDDPQAMPIDRVGRRKKIGEEVESISFYISMVMGFIVGFWGVCGALVVKRSWRQAYYQGFDNLKGRMVFFTTDKVIRCLGKIKFDRT